MDKKRKEIAEFLRQRLDRFIDTSNLSDEEVIKVASNGEHLPFTSRDVDTALHNLSNMKDLREQNPQWYEALTIILTSMKQLSSKQKGWEDDVYYL